MTDRDDECEMGYWLGKPFWGAACQWHAFSTDRSESVDQGIMPEAAKEMLRHAFEDLGMQKVWCGYYEGNNKSKRVQEKYCFKYQWRSENVDVPLMHEKRTGHVSLITKEDWMAEQSKIEIINENQFIEYTKDGYATTFTITVTKPFERWEFDMENDNMKGHWTDIFLYIMVIPK